MANSINVRNLSAYTQLGRISNILAFILAVTACLYLQFAAHAAPETPGIVAAAISAGATHNCEIKSNGALVCWGSDDDGQATPPSGSFTQVSAGATHSCAIKSDNTVVCWGDDSEGQATPPSGAFIQITTGAGYSCAIKSNNTIVCWGDDSQGQLSSPVGAFTQVSAGDFHTCAIKFDGTGVCWGDDSDGQLQVPGGGFRQISAGGSHTCGIKTDKTLDCWGNDDDGQSSPPSGAFAQISAGSAHNCGIKSDGTLACWGDDGEGQATPPAGIFTQVSAGDMHTCAIRSDGTVICWGDNTEGQAATLTLEPAVLPLASMGAPYSQVIIAVGENYTATITSLTLSTGALPPGLNLTSTPGALSGTPSQNGSFTFTLRGIDANGLSAEQAFTLIVDAPPIADSQNAIVAQNTPYNITLTASDAELDLLTYTVLTLPAHGDLSGTAPNLTYTPNTGYSGPDSFTFKANDGKLDSNTATINIAVTPNQPVNIPPHANSQSVTTIRNAAKSITLTASDADNNPLTYALLTPPAHGTLTGTLPSLIYTPTTNFTGNDSFTFKANDGLADSNIATISIAVNNFNTIPVANAQSAITLKNTPITLTLTGSDNDNDPLTYVVSQPLTGTLSATGSSVTYTPKTDYIGNDSFTFKVNDGQADSTSATVSILVKPNVPTASNPPVANPQNVTVARNTAKNIVLTASDTEGDALTYSVVNKPLNGNLKGTAPNLTYTPNAGFIGNDSFTFIANDGKSDSEPATISIQVISINAAPVANDQAITLAQDTGRSIILTASDDNGDALNYTIVTQPTHGQLTGAPPTLAYMPASGFTGDDSFTFKVDDGQVDSNIATVTLHVTAGQVTNTPPIANDQNLTTPQDTPKNMLLTASDADNNPLTYSIVSEPQHGALSGTRPTLASPTLIYTPNAGFNGADSFTFKVNDGKADSNLATVNISVGVSAAQGSIVGLIYNDKDGDGQKDGNESGIANVTVILSAATATASAVNGVQTPATGATPDADRNAITDSDGRYRFDQVPVGNYLLHVVVPTGYVLVGPAQVAVTVTLTGEVTPAPFAFKENGLLFLPLIRR